MNVGIYRGMIGQRDTCPMLLIKGGQHWGHHFAKYSRPRRADAGRLRDRLGSHHAVPGRLADPDRRLRVGRDGRLPRRAGRAGALRDGGPGGPGLGRDRPRGVHQRRPGHLGEGGAVRRVHRPRLRRADAAADHEGHVHHAPARSDLPRLPRGHAARLLQREQRDVGRAARGHRLEHPEGRRHSRHPGRLRPPDHQRREHRGADHARPTRASPSRSPPRCGATAPPSTATSTSTWWTTTSTRRPTSRSTGRSPTA